jgi:hypothetical protein
MYTNSCRWSCHFVMLRTVFSLAFPFEDVNYVNNISWACVIFITAATEAKGRQFTRGSRRNVRRTSVISKIMLKFNEDWLTQHDLAWTVRDGMLCFLLNGGGVYLRRLLNKFLINMRATLNKYRTDFTDRGIIKWGSINW